MNEKYTREELAAMAEMERMYSTDRKIPSASEAEARIAAGQLGRPIVPAPASIGITKDVLRHVSGEAESALGSDLMLKIGRSINKGEYTALAAALDEMNKSIARAYGCTEDQARLVMIYIHANPGKSKPQPPRLATSAERKRVAQAERAKSGKPKKNNG